MKAVAICTRNRCEHEMSCGIGNDATHNDTRAEVLQKLIQEGCRPPRFGWLEYNGQHGTQKRRDEQDED